MRLLSGLVWCRAAAAWAEDMALSRPVHGNLQDLFHPLPCRLCCELELELSLTRSLFPTSAQSCTESSRAPEHMVLDALCLTPTASTGLTIPPPDPRQTSSLDN